MLHMFILLAARKKIWNEQRFQKQYIDEIRRYPSNKSETSWKYLTLVATRAGQLVRG